VEASGLVSESPQSSESAVSRWTHEGGDYDVPHLRLRQVAELAARARPVSLLDLGCARGMLRRLVPVERYVGCDFVAPPAGAAHFEFYRCDFNNEPLPDAIPTVDVAVCSGLLEYVSDIPALVSQVRAKLADDGRFVATYVNMNHLLRAVDVLRGRTMFQHPDWRGFWSPADIAARIEAGGFRVVETYETTRGVRPEPRPADTVDRPVVLRKTGATSRLLAHELILVAVPA
jgi:SAM-dependent methyltransferase